jgi:pyridinium-3,5-bisthiocarboxylic acid mononucleotide nickel chelatase
MKTLYLDIFSGISGDMFLGAALDLGVDLRQLETELGKLRVGGYHLHASRKQQSNIEGVKFDVHLETDPHRHDHGHDHDHEHQHGHGHKHQHERAREDESAHKGSRNFAEIRHMIESSELSEWVKQKSISVFQRVAAAEGKIHGRPPEAVHFHEVGAIDSIVDIVGACIALEVLGKPRVLAAPVVDGTGWVDCAHGRFPVPTTATLEILGARGVALTQCEEPHELVTPTGAALLAEFAETFGPMQNLVARKIGYGLGTRQNKTRPNVLRAVLAEQTTDPVQQASERLDWESDSIAVLQTNIDDCNAEILGYFVERALAAGALDVFHTPIQMKKNRPGVLLTVLCTTADADKFTEMLLRETSAFGVRRSLADRRKLRRESTTVQTPYGAVTVKLGKLNGQVLHATPEFESCKKRAAEAHAPLRVVYEAAEQASRALPQS